MDQNTKKEVDEINGIIASLTERIAKSVRGLDTSLGDLADKMKAVHALSKDSSGPDSPLNDVSDFFAKRMTSMAEQIQRASMAQLKQNKARLDNLFELAKEGLEGSEQGKGVTKQYEMLYKKLNEEIVARKKVATGLGNFIGRQGLDSVSVVGALTKRNPLIGMGIKYIMERAKSSSKIDSFTRNRTLQDSLEYRDSLKKRRDKLVNDDIDAKSGSGPRGGRRGTRKGKKGTAEETRQYAPGSEHSAPTLPRLLENKPKDDILDAEFEDVQPRALGPGSGRLLGSGTKSQLHNKELTPDQIALVREMIEKSSGRTQFSRKELGDMHGKLRGKKEAPNFIVKNLNAKTGDKGQYDVESLLPEGPRLAPKGGSGKTPIEEMLGQLIVTDAKIHETLEGIREDDQKDRDAEDGAEEEKRIEDEAAREELLKSIRQLKPGEDKGGKDGKRGKEGGGLLGRTLGGDLATLVGADMLGGWLKTLIAPVGGALMSAIGSPVFLAGLTAGLVAYMGYKVYEVGKALVEAKKAEDARFKKWQDDLLTDPNPQIAEAAQARKKQHDAGKGYAMSPRERRAKGLEEPLVKKARLEEEARKKKLADDATSKVAPVPASIAPVAPIVEPMPVDAPVPAAPPKPAPKTFVPPTQSAPATPVIGTPPVLSTPPEINVDPGGLKLKNSPNPPSGPVRVAPPAPPINKDATTPQIIGKAPGIASAFDGARMPGNFKLSDKGLQQMTINEGFMADPYEDPVGSGLWSIGYGHQIKPGENLKHVTKAQAMEILRKDVQGSVDSLNRGVKVPLTQDQFDAMVDFGHSGPGYIQNILRGSKDGTYKGINANGGDYEGTAAFMKRIVNVRTGKVGKDGRRALQKHAGLMARREREATPFLKSQPQAASAAMVRKPPKMGEALMNTRKQTDDAKAANVSGGKKSVVAVNAPSTTHNNTAVVSQGINPRNTDNTLRDARFRTSYNT